MNAMVKSGVTSVANKSFPNNSGDSFRFNMTTIDNNDYLFESNLHLAKL